MTTLLEIRQSAPGGILVNDRGNGAGGPWYIPEIGHGEQETDHDTFAEVSESDDPEAWTLVREAAVANKCDTNVTHVWIGERGPGDNGHQLVIGY